MNAPETERLVARCAERRGRVLDALGDGLLLVRTAPEVLRNGDVHHPHRPGSEFHYLTGFPEPDAVLCAWRETQGRSKVDRSVLFVRPRDRSREIWDGPRHGLTGAVRKFGVDEAYPIEELGRRLPDLLAPHAVLHTRLGADPEFDRRLFDVFRYAAFARRRRNVPAHPVLSDPTPTISTLRQIKDADEIALLERAAAISAEAHLAAMTGAQAGMTEYQVQQVLEGVFRRHGSRRNGYQSIVASGPNACVLHYIENTRKLRADELLLLDAGAEVEMYTADITRTWPVGGRFTAPQRAVYAAVLKAQRAALRAVKPGRTWNAPHLAAQRSLTRSLIEFGVLRGDATRAFRDERFKPWYMHGTSHWLGMDVHDVGAYEDADGKPIRFAPGMVLTVEPGLYFGPRDRSAPSELRGIGVRIEDDVLVTDDGHRVLTDAAPKDIAAIEAACTGAG